MTLAGEWRFRWLAPAGVTASGRMAVPGTWVEDQAASGRQVLPKAGRALDEVELAGLPHGRYALQVPPVYGASRVRLDGRQISERGTLGDDAASTVYLTRAHFVHFEASGAPVMVGIEIATFRHRDMGC